MTHRPFQPITRLKKSLLKKMRRYEPTRRLLEDHEQRLYLSAHPESPWRMEPRAPLRVVEAGRAQIRERVYLFGGYETLGKVSNAFHCFNLEARKWEQSGTMPVGMAQTHQGVVSDGERYAYIVTGQLGANCSPSTAACFSFDSQTQTFAHLPALPEGRYMPIVFLYEGRIHCMSGSGLDRNTACTEHWSLGVADGRALETVWRVESSYGLQRTHTASHIVGSRLYVLGGQTGDVMSVSGDSEYACAFEASRDAYFDEVCYIELVTGKRVDCAPMPLAMSHTEHSSLQIAAKLLIVGGVLGRLEMNDSIFEYDLEADCWTQVGRLPYKMKSKVSAHWNGRLFIIGGQRAVSETDARPGDVVNSVWSMPCPLK